MKAFGIKTVDAPEIQKQLLLAEAISLEIQQAGRKKKNKKESISTLLSGKILKKVSTSQLRRWKKWYKPEKTNQN